MRPEPRGSLPFTHKQNKMKTETLIELFIVAQAAIVVVSVVVCVTLALAPLIRRLIVRARAPKPDLYPDSPTMAGEDIACLYTPTTYPRVSSKQTNEK